MLRIIYKNLYIHHYNEDVTNGSYVSIIKLSRKLLPECELKLVATTCDGLISCIVGVPINRITNH